MRKGRVNGVGKRGPASKPTALRILHGDRADRINDNEPTPGRTDVEPPDWLAGPALEVWQEYAPDLKRQGVLTAWDVEAFGCWCDAVARRRAAAAALDAEGEVVDLAVFGKNGELTGHRRSRNPWLLVLNQADAQVQRYGARFGLTPSDRAQLSGGDGRSDPTEDLLTS